MSLNAEWRARINRWKETLRKHCYEVLGSVALEGFVTREHLSAAQARRGPFNPMPAGSAWGMKWEYGWFRASVVLPAAARGRRIVLRMAPAREGLVFVDGNEVGSLGGPRTEITLCTRGVPGRRHAILAEFYAGHGPLVCGFGPVAPGEESVPDVRAPQARVGETTFGIWREEVYQLLMDVETLDQLRTSLDPDSLRVAEIDAGLRDMTLIADFELPPDRMLATVRAARKRLKPLLDCANGSSAPTFFAFGHAHLDAAWLWPLAETARKAARTLANQLTLIGEYPYYRFLHSQAYLFQVVKQKYPALYRRVKKAVRAGRIIADGGMWIEADTNMTGGESLIRQFMHGKRFFAREFGVDSKVLWLPDVFGYSGALPQILKGCGVDYFATAKIFWLYHGGEPFPHNTFTWEGIDGSGVTAHVYADYNADTGPARLIEYWNGRAQKDGISTRMLPFGFGDGGGGPTRDQLEFLRREGDLEGAPRVRVESPRGFFRDLEKRGVPPVKFVGELYFQAHRGVYTSQAKIKKGNRKAEFALREAEFWSSLACAAAGCRRPRESMEELWKEMLLHQFHDILPGSSIARVCEQTEAAHTAIIESCAAVTRAAAQSLVRKKSGSIAVFNSLGWGRSELVPLPKGFTAASDEHGRALACQKVADTVCAQVWLPPCGYTTIRRSRRTRTENRSAPRSMRIVETDVLRVKFDEAGGITGIVDTETKRELCAGPCNVLQMYRDVPSTYDAWDIESNYSLCPVALKGKATFKSVADGPLVWVRRVRRRLNESDLTQDIILRAGSRRIDFATTIVWRETHKLLKVNFPVDIRATEALHEIQFGYIGRPNHKSRPLDVGQFEVCNHKWTALVEQGRGAAVLNDCKYGVNVDGNSINLTLLRSPAAPDMNADKGVQEFTYGLFFWNGPFIDSNLVREAYQLNSPPFAVAGDGGTQSMLSVDAPNVVIETVKAAEDGSGDVIVRLYESMRCTTRCALTCRPKPRRAEITDMLENRLRPVAVKNGRIALELRPFEIQTLRLRF